MSTPGNMVRALYAELQDSISGGAVNEYDQGWCAGVAYAMDQLEDLTSKIEGWEIRQEVSA